MLMIMTNMMDVIMKLMVTIMLYVDDHDSGGDDDDKVKDQNEVVMVMVMGIKVMMMVTVKLMMMVLMLIVLVVISPPQMSVVEGTEGAAQKMTAPNIQDLGQQL